MAGIKLELGPFRAANLTKAEVAVPERRFSLCRNLSQFVR